MKRKKFLQNIFFAIPSAALSDFLGNTQERFLYPEKWGAKADGKTHSSGAIKKCIDEAVRLNKTVRFSKGTYILDKEIHVDLKEGQRLNIEGQQAVLKPLFDSKRANLSGIVTIACSSGSESVKNRVIIDGLRLDGSNFPVTWTEKNITNVKQLQGFTILDISQVEIVNCYFSNIQGKGIVVYGAQNFICKNLNFLDVGGHFPLQQNDSYGDAIYFSLYDLENRGKNRKMPKMTISNCILKGYNTFSNGNFASRIGVCLEGYKCSGVDHKVSLIIDKCDIQYYDRAIHIENINVDVAVSNTTIKNCFSYFVNVYSKGVATWKNCAISNFLKPNPLQERFGSGKRASFDKKDLKMKSSLTNTRITN